MDAETIEACTKLAWLVFFGCLAYVMWTLKDLGK